MSKTCHKLYPLTTKNNEIFCEDKNISFYFLGPMIKFDIFFWKS